MYQIQEQIKEYQQNRKMISLEFIDDNTIHHSENTRTTKRPQEPAMGQAWGPLIRSLDHKPQIKYEKPWRDTHPLGDTIRSISFW